ncbi:hypothetical protein LCGC14_1614570 [marine sediment metagenome]|uniref:Uncharacterized protein n=1 Tax=marine sediment metagenome TaxID=412755 RepID=A0A0F9I7L3_9ZZZZ
MGKAIDSREEAMRRLRSNARLHVSPPFLPGRAYPKNITASKEPSMDTKVPETPEKSLLMVAMDRVSAHEHILYDEDGGIEKLKRRIEALEDKPEPNISWLIMSIASALNLMTIVLYSRTDGSIVAVATFLGAMILLGLIMDFLKHRRD